MQKQLKQENARIAKAMLVGKANRAKVANGKTAAVKTKSVPATKSQRAPAPKPIPTPRPQRKPAAPQPPTLTEAEIIEAKAKGLVDHARKEQAARPQAEAALSIDKHAESLNALGIVIRAGALKTALQAVERACAKKSTLPVLSTIHMETVGAAGLKLTATNLDFMLWQLVEAQVLHAGSVCVPPLLADLLAKLDDDILVTLTVSPKTQIVNVAANAVTTHIKGLDASEFPQLAPPNGKTVQIGMDLAHETVVEITKRITPFASADDARPVLTGIGISAPYPKHAGEDTAVRFVAADGFRLAHLEREATLHFDAAKEDTFSVIVPAKLFGEILKLTDDETKPVQLLFHLQYEKGKYAGGVVQVHLGTSGLRMNLLDGAYPDHSKIDVEPPDAPIIPLFAGAVVPAVERASLFAASSIVRLAPLPASLLLRVQAASAEDGDYEEQLRAVFDMERRTPDGYEIAFNARFLSEALKAVAYQNGAHSIPMRVTDPSKPAYLSAPRFRVVMMPMHIGDKANTPNPSPTPPQPSDAPTPEQVAANDKASKEVIAKVDAAHAKQQAEPKKSNTAKPAAVKRKHTK